ncbi:sensor histidine kinase [Romboutsia sedimentorum]|uniref:histidine kinase n=1 Tax=Romboutsia sedimentorum TaxID=1368474 RepID=A0ABT7E6T1_9FIRM|nr:sensor histidine kinase [Romboutsia sedimentorum]MDK2562638.1 sensor histidine kinase [Romboutsia sedimentorum]MDK2585878.1 sensor histidine kinase [Romboutsia sedimentorum]
MNSNKIKNILLTLSMASLAVLLVVIPATLTLYGEHQGLWTSYMHEDKKILEKDFYKSNKFEFSMLRPISYLLSDSVSNRGESKKEIEDIKKQSKNEINNSYKNMKFLAINVEDNSYYSNTKYKTVEEYKKNIDEYLDIEIHKTPMDKSYSKDINGKVVKNKSDIEYKLLNAIDIENMEIYISLPNPKEFKYNDNIYNFYNSYTQATKVVESLIAIVITSLAVFLISIFSYKLCKRNTPNKEGRILKISKKIPLELWLMGIFVGGVYYIVISFSGYYSGYDDIYTYIGMMSLAFIVNLIFIFIIHLFIKVLFGFDSKLDLLKNTIIYKIYKLLNKIYKIIKKNMETVLISSKKIPLIKRVIGLSVLFIVCSIILGLFIDSILYAGGIIFVITPFIAMGIFTWYIVKQLTYLSKIMDGTEKIKNGELNYKIETNGYDNFTVLAENINNIGDGLEKSIDSQLRSERMKSELITNVSHDLKTPLTSIINYVELIKKEENIQPQYINEYVNVLEAKGKRLKALIEDLFEASKASSGNIELNMEKLDIKQLLRQSIGEMEEKLGKANLDLKLNMLDDKVYVYADGRRMYRVFENLLSNIAKYSLNNTRVYIDLVENNENIKITMKNISSYELNFDVDEITERFKRSDESRNTEGSGLGLAIAKDLVKIQGGTFDVEIDGDLFKVTLEFKNIIK